MQSKIVKTVTSDSPGNTKEAFLSNLQIQGSTALVTIGFIYKDSNGMVLGTGNGQALQFNLNGAAADDPNIGNYQEPVRAGFLADQAKYNAIIDALKPVIEGLISAALYPAEPTE